MKILVTGARGALGTALVEHLTTETDWSVAEATRTTYRSHTLTENFESGQKTAWAELFNNAATRPDTVINTAAYTDVDGCEQHRDKAHRDNVELVAHLVDVCRRHGTHLIQLSTDNVFDGHRGPYSETAQPQPINYYGRTKLAAENECRRLDQNTTIVRTMWLYGGGGSKISYIEWVTQQLAGGKVIRIAQDEIGNPTLCDDVAAGIRRLIELDLHGIFNLAGPEIMSRLDAAYIVANWIGADPALIQPVQSAELNRRAQRPLQTGLSTLRAHAILGIRGTTLQQGLQFIDTHRGRKGRERTVS